MKKCIAFCVIVILFSGCNARNKFLILDRGFKSQCGIYFHKKINDKNIYGAKNEFLQIFILEDNQYKVVDIYQKYNFSVVPIEYCNNEWCKIYYPCDNTQYFVKKDDIVLFNGITY